MIDIKVSLYQDVLIFVIGRRQHGRETNQSKFVFRSTFPPMNDEILSKFLPGRAHIIIPEDDHRLGYKFLIISCIYLLYTYINISLSVVIAATRRHNTAIRRHNAVIHRQSPPFPPPLRRPWTA